MPSIEIALVRVHFVLGILVAPRSSVIAVATVLFEIGAHDIVIDDVNGAIVVVRPESCDTKTLRRALRDDRLLLATFGVPFVGALFDHVLNLLHAAGIKVALLMFTVSMCAFVAVWWPLTSAVAVALLLSFLLVPLANTAGLVPISVGQARESGSGGKSWKCSCEHSQKFHFAG